MPKRLPDEMPLKALLPTPGATLPIPLAAAAAIPSAPGEPTPFEAAVSLSRDEGWKRRTAAALLRMALAVLAGAPPAQPNPAQRARRRFALQVLRDPLGIAGWAAALVALRDGIDRDAPDAAIERAIVELADVLAMFLREDA